VKKFTAFLSVLGAIMLPAGLQSIPQTGIPSQLVEVYDLRSFTHPTHTRIVIEVGKLREYAWEELHAPDRVQVDVLNARLNPILHGKTILDKTEFLNKIQIGQRNQDTVRLTADVDFTRIGHYRVWHLYDPFRIIVDLYPKESPAAVKPASSKEKTPQPPKPTAQGYSLARQLGLGVKNIVIDPGHGGTDPGCLGRKGLREKDLALDISLQLRDLLDAAGFNVFLTRETDITVPLENRPVIANQKKADVFISIHVNSHPNKKRSGVQTFFLNLSHDPVVIENAARENATSSKTISQMQDTIKKIFQNDKIVESREMAEQIQKNLVKCLAQKYSEVIDLSVKGGPYWVLIGGGMPSILAEVSHMSNAREEERLATPAYRKQVAQGLYEGLIAYIRSLGKELERKTP